MTSVNPDIAHEAYCVAEEILDAVKIPREQQSEAKDKIINRLEAFARAILEQAAGKPVPRPGGGGGSPDTR